jgi:hypothetical protein
VDLSELLALNSVDLAKEDKLMFPKVKLRLPQVPMITASDHSMMEIKDLPDSKDYSRLSNK